MYYSPLGQFTFQKQTSEVLVVLKNKRFSFLKLTTGLFQELVGHYLIFSFFHKKLEVFLLVDSRLMTVQIELINADGYFFAPLIITSLSVPGIGLVGARLSFISAVLACLAEGPSTESASARLALYSSIAFLY